ncbi:MAG: NAD(P)/FAD-dependent oxidoreductase [Candidatus Bathyarchaeota archaeon]|nr:NAD(P)/FAD-dependent oxidoreductase [Candidatus Bathyarchaeota archaeon]
MTSIIIIGGGIIGTLLARELAKYKLTVTLIEKEIDIAFGSTKANSGIIHAGYDDSPHTMKARLCAYGNTLWPTLAQQLRIPFTQPGSLVIATAIEDYTSLETLQKRGQQNGVPALQLIDNPTTLRRLEPNLTPHAIAALHAPTAGLTSPYEAAIAAAENARANGVRIILSQPVQRITIKTGKVTGLYTPNGFWPADYIINTAGLYADTISSLAGIATFSITPVKGEYLLYDKQLTNIVNHILFPLPSLKSKGVVVTQTIHGSLLLGPTATPTHHKQDLATTTSGRQEVLTEAHKLVPLLKQYHDQSITSFSGLRAEADTDDFIIEAYEEPYGFINVAGIKSPGLTAAPAIADKIITMLEDYIGALKEKTTVKCTRTPIPRPITTARDKNTQSLITNHPRFGHLICRCEHVSEGEVIEAIQRGASTLDGIKLRTRAGMGRCQGGFCTPHLIHLLTRKTGMKVEAITKRGGTSHIVSSPVRAQWRGENT